MVSLSTKGDGVLRSNHEEDDVVMALAKWLRDLVDGESPLCTESAEDDSEDEE
jgi:hypothetical protein